MTDAKDISKWIRHKLINDYRIPPESLTIRVLDNLIQALPQYLPGLKAPTPIPTEAPPLAPYARWVETAPPLAPYTRWVKTASLCWIVFGLGLISISIGAAILVTPLSLGSALMLFSIGTLCGSAIIAGNVPNFLAPEIEAYNKIEALRHRCEDEDEDTDEERSEK